MFEISDVMKNFDYKFILDFRAGNGVHTKPPPKLQLNILYRGVGDCGFENCNPPPERKPLGADDDA